jgi:hypothetical protein
MTRITSRGGEDGVTQPMPLVGAERPLVRWRALRLIWPSILKGRTVHVTATEEEAK